MILTKIEIPGLPEGWRAVAYRRAKKGHQSAGNRRGAS